MTEITEEIQQKPEEAKIQKQIVEVKKATKKPEVQVQAEP